jgi:hypothetical protein
MGASVVVAVDGPSKVGSTFLGAHVSNEAKYQREWAHTRLDHIDRLRGVNNPSRDVETLRGTVFQRIGNLSAGNFFRALTLAQAIGELVGRPARVIGIYGDKRHRENSAV